MKKFTLSILPVFVLLVFSSSCQHEENPSPDPVATAVDLNINLHYPELESFDSAYVVFESATTTIIQKLTLDNAMHIATGHIMNLPSGDWTISTSYFSTAANHQRLEKKGVVNLLINPTATDLISTEHSVSISQKNNPLYLKSFEWSEFYFHQLFLENKIEGFVRLPKDPTDPYFEIVTFQPKWVYVFNSRSFYSRSMDGTSNHYQGGSGFEVYGESGENHDRLERHIIDTSSLEPGILTVKDKTWNFVSGYLILYDHTGNEVFLFYEWDLRIPDGG